MTVTTYMGFNECVGVITSDTKQVANFLGGVWELPDKDDKIMQLSPDLITISSGYQYLSDFVFRELRAAKPKHLEDVYEVLKGITPEVKSRFESGFHGRTDDFMSIFIIGINKKGKSNVIAYKFTGGEVEIIFKNEPWGAYDSFATYPSDEHLEEIFFNIGQLKLTNRDDFRIIAMDVTKHLIELQKELFRIYPDKVSDTFCYYAIYKDVYSNEYIHKSGKVNIFEGNIEF